VRKIIYLVIVTLGTALLAYSLYAQQPQIIENSSRFEYHCHEVSDKYVYCHSHPDAVHNLLNYTREPQVEYNVQAFHKVPQLKLIGHMPFDFNGDGIADPGPRSITDVWAFRNFAYVGTYDKPVCSDLGVRIVDISEPSKPLYVTNIPSPPNTRANAIKVSHIITPYYEGDILIHSNEPCVTTYNKGRGGIEVYDVTNPRTPIHLSSFYNPPIHNLFMYQQGNRAYVLLADVGSSALRVVNITNPRNPMEVVAVGSKELKLKSDLLGNYQAVYVHDVWAKVFQADHTNPYYAGKVIAYLSYWDAGLVMLDITNPSSPKLLGQSSYADPDPLNERFPEGNSHSAVPNDQGNIVLMGDEDLSPFTLMLTIEDGPYRNREYQALGALEVPIAWYIDHIHIVPVVNKTITGSTYYLGSACTADRIRPAPSDQAIALLDWTDCSIETKAKNTADMGYRATVIFADDIPIDAIIRKQLSIPTFFVKKATGLAMKEHEGTRIRIGIAFDGWGYLRLFDVSNPNNIREVGQFTVSNTFINPPPIGNHTIHNIAIDGNIAFISWYADGVRVVNFSNPKEPKEIAYFKAPTTFDKEGKLVAHTDFWGVYLHTINGERYILASDRNFGLYIFKLEL
jgi:hypothetical protein